MADTEPPFAHVAIVGFGLIGGSLGMAIRERWPKTIVIAIDRKDVIESAMRLHAADVGGDDLVMAAGAELIVLAAPVGANIDILSRMAEDVPGEALVTDVGSTKRAIVEAARALPGRLRFVGGHPLAGAAAGGIEMARTDLFTGRPWILTPVAGDTAAGPLTAFLQQLGVRAHVMTAEEHDRLLAALSHLPQIAASALMHVVGSHVGADALALAGRGLRDTTRLATSPPDVWRDIAATNADHIGRAIDDLIAALQRVRSRLGRDASAIDELFSSAAEWKRALERSSETR
jgi:prephenate dehydrogenase